MNPWIAVGTATYAAIGAVGLLRPERVPTLFGGTAPTAAARSEIRAVYGGLPLAMAGVGLAAPIHMGILSAGMAAGRAASVAHEQETGPVTKAFIGIEVALAAAYALGARARR